MKNWLDAVIPEQKIKLAWPGIHRQTGHEQGTDLKFRVYRARPALFKW